ncbi:MAG: DUF4403 family protein [Williamsia sp.]|nr:DUF4403 family protein [Williamsia sp.]
MKQLQVFTTTILMIITFGCNSHNADAPDEKIVTNGIKQDSSTMSIPIEISNGLISHQIMSSINYPLAETTQVIKVPVLNPVTVPELVITKVTTQVACDFVQKVSIGGGWKCAVCPPCCLTDVVVHKMCDVTKDVQSWVDREVIKKINMDVPVYYKAALNDIRFEGNRETFFTHVKIDFALRADVDAKIIKTLIASCGIHEKMPQVELILSSVIKFGDDASIILTDKKWAIQWNSPCNLTALDINVEDLLNLPIVKSLIEKKIDELVQNKIPNNVSLKEKFDKEWEKIAAPIKLGDYGYLNLNIGQVNTSQLFASADNIQAEIGAICKPQIIITNNPPTSTTVPPAPLFKSTPLDKGFNLNLLASFSIDKLNEYAKDKFNDIKQTISNKLVEIESIKLYQSDDKLIVQTKLVRPFKGKLYFWGTPKLDTSSSVLSFENLSYTTDSKSVVAKFADWLLHVNAIENIIKSKFQYKYEKNINDAIQKLGDINQPISNNMSLIGQLKNVSPVFINISDNNINAVLNFKGNAMLQIK